jgi:hypothetical protein
MFSSLAIQQNSNVGKTWILTKNPIKTNFRISCLYVLHVHLALPIKTHGAIRERKLAPFEHRIKQK